MNDGIRSVRPYTATLIFLTLGSAVAWLVSDMRASGQHHLSGAFGVHSNLWLTVWLIVTVLALLTFGTVAGHLFARYSGQSIREAGDEYVMSGAVDISVWSALGALSGTIVLFQRIPYSWLGWLRPLLIPIVATLVSLALSTLLIKALYRVLYPPIARWR